MQARRHLISFLAIFLLLAGCRDSAAGVGCRYVTLRPIPGWVSSGAWMKKGAELVVVDARDRKVLSFDPQGKGFVTQPLTQAFQSSSPLRITSDSIARNLFVELERGRFAVLDSRRAFPIHWKNLFETSPVSQASQGTRKLDNLYLWAPVNMELLSYASVKEVSPGGAESWRDGFVRFPFENPRQLQPLVARSREASKIFYKLGHPLIASLGDTGYLLFLDSGSPGLYLNRKGSAELEPMDALDRLYSGKNGKKGSPLLPSFIRPEDFPAVMRAVERSSMPVGLYGWDDSLYVLFRSPDNGGTKWGLKKVNPETDRVVASFDIPTRANHLTVVPGPREWAFIEKGPVRGHKDQDVNSVLFVPTSRIKTASGGNLCR
jgi:hypothetical protein